MTAQVFAGALDRVLGERLRGHVSGTTLSDPGLRGQWGELRAIIEGAILDAPRSSQRAIGPSGIGDPCLFCLGHALLGQPHPRREGDVPWLATIGTAVHAWLAEVFEGLSGDGGRWLVETRVCVGEILGEEVEGTCDLFDAQSGAVWDWKILGASSLSRFKARGPSQTYQVQAHLYGQGYARAGKAVTSVGVVALPRGAMSLSEACVWSTPFDPGVATLALARAEGVLNHLRGASSTQAALAALPSDSDCFACNFGSRRRGGLLSR